MKISEEMCIRDRMNAVEKMAVSLKTEQVSKLYPKMEIMMVIMICILLRNLVFAANLACSHELHVFVSYCFLVQMVVIQLYPKPYVPSA